MTAELVVAARPRIRHRGRTVAWTAIPLAVIVVIAVVGPLLPLQNPNSQLLTSRLQPPVWQSGGSVHHLLGTDTLGRDLLARLVSGARLTLLIGALGVLAGAIPGTLLGLVAGYRRGWVDTVVSRLVDAQLALPFFLIAITVISARGRSLAVLILVLAVIGWAQFARIVRAETLSLRERPFVLGLKAAGVPGWRIVLLHLFPNLAGTVLVMCTLQVGTVILAESALSFLGLGVVAPDISWGAMLASGRDVVNQAWWVVAFPGIAITVLVILVNLLGDGLRSRYDPRLRRDAR